MVTGRYFDVITECYLPRSGLVQPSFGVEIDALFYVTLRAERIEFYPLSRSVESTVIDNLQCIAKNLNCWIKDCGIMDKTCWT